MLVRPTGQPSAVKLSRRVRGNKPFNLRRGKHHSTHSRGLSYGYEWRQTGQNQMVTVPWTVTSSLSNANLERIKFGMETLQRDVGCMDFPFVERKDLSSTDWEDGIGKRV